jgi:signal transduction histidine kinase/ligand-binding sensor domain-containing protein/DNA-binding response OmpR family regulator
MNSFVLGFIKRILLAILLLQMTFFVVSGNNKGDYLFRNITYEDNLPFYKYCHSICQDKQGFIWLGSEIGLHRYDSNVFLNFVHDSSDSSSIRKGEVKAIANFEEHKLLIGTSTGVDILNTQNNTFLHVDMFDVSGQVLIQESVQGFIFHDDNDLYLHTHFHVYKYHQEKHCFIRVQSGVEMIESNNSVIESIISVGDCFVYGTDRGGLFVSDVVKKTCIVIDQTRLGSNKVNSVFKSDCGKIWIATNSGICVVDSIEDLINGDIHTLEVIADVQGSLINGLGQDNNGMLWASSDGDGVFLINPKDLTVVQFKERSNTSGSLMSNKAEWVYVDDFNNLWVFLKNYGFSVANLDDEAFYYSIKRSVQDESALSGNIVNSFAQDIYGNIWVGTDGFGLNSFNQSNGRYKHFRKFDKSNGLKSDVILDLFLDRDNNLWIATYQGGVTMLNTKTGSFETFLHNEKVKNTLCGNEIAAISEDNEGNMYFLSIGHGLSKYNKVSKTFSTINSTGNPKFRLSHNGGISMIKDNDGNVWVGTYYGLNRIDAYNKEIKHYFSIENNSQSLSDFRINCLFQDSRGGIWIGTNQGLDFYDKELDVIRRIYSKSFFGDVAINSIIEDDYKSIWIGTDSGIIQIHLDEIGADSARYAHYLSDRMFLNQAAFKANDGKLYFGSNSGFTEFLPSKVPDFNDLPKLALTELRVHDRLIKAGHKWDNHQILTENIQNTERVTFTHLENNFAFVFSALDYSKKYELSYLYKLEGFDQEWRVANIDQRSAVYTNLDVGTYRFEVKLLSGYNRIESDVVSVEVVVLPPWWKSRWAKFLYLIALMGVIFIFLISVKKNATLQRRLYFERIERQKEIDVAQIKEEFFTNVTHEFRTPLTLIIGPLENLRAKYNEDSFLRGQVDVISRSANRLLRLINELLEVRKIEEKEGELELVRADFVGFASKIVEGFSLAMENSKIQFVFEANESKLEACFDMDKMEKVIFNLLSNALKHTPQNGRVVCEVNRISNDYVSFKVIDNGSGIKPDVLPKVFDKFYTKGLEESNSGIGLGLYLTKKIIILHNGNIYASNNPDKGASFEIVFPVENMNYVASPEAFVEFIGDYNYQSISGNKIIEEVSNDENANERKSTTILVVEDNDDVRTYVGSILNDNYEVVYARNGEEGLKLAFETIPDLIVTDVMMPKLDGKSLCHAIKTDVRTSHIPIIMITALAGIDSRIEGLEVGADSYIVKPFHPKHLLVRVKHLMSLRKLLQVKYSGVIDKGVSVFDYQAQEVDKLSVDEVFINRMVAYIENNISNAELEVEDICQEMGMNYLQLYRKIKAVTDMSIKQFVLTIRMKNAAKLLESGKFTISEVAFDVGFSSPAYFSKIFKRFFEKTPSEFIQENDSEANSLE